MQKIICSQQVRLPQKTLKAMLVSSIIVGLLLPLSAISAPTDDSTSSDGAAISDTYADGKVVPVSIDKEEVTEVTDSTIQDKKSEIPDIAPMETPSIESPSPSINTEQEINKPPTAAADRYLNEKEEAETPVATTSQSTDKEVADKEPSWMSMEYLLGGGLLLLLLGGGLLLFSKINELKNDNKNLAYNNANLKRQSDKQTKLANSAQEENKKLKSEIMRLNTLDEQHPDPVEIDSELSSAWVVDTPELTIIDDLNNADRTQLASIFENWLRTNRGNTKVDDLIPEHIQKKLKHWHYAIELWGQGSGLDSVDITKNTMHTAVISLIKNVNEGYAYCYIKPNSMSSLWKNKAWYTVEKVNGTLKLTGELLESN